MRIEFLKMQGLGNDFLVFDAPAAGNHLDSGTLRALADRHTGVGFDQALMLEAPRTASARVFYRIFNSDGTEVEQCGNGARCIAALLYSRAPQLGRDFEMQSLGGTVHARVREDGLVSVDMGVPNFDPRALPFDAPDGKGAAVEAPLYSLRVDGAELQIGAVSMGNPHAVLQVPDVKTAPLERYGPSIENHPRFPKRTNVEFMQIVGRGHIRLRVFERGVGETLACGTGACAAVAVGRRHGLLDDEVRVELPGGSAMVSWASEGERLWLTGPAATVFAGSIEI
ncbi:MAG TPA: diaminopimelate epimerase [Steroidobacteraceae bacterium]|jgi:diaminopimelate epimerase|nr:diaminopimelate epimerase [Steroidobacteraceae bacterium]